MTVDLVALFFRTMNVFHGTFELFQQTKHCSQYYLIQHMILIIKLATANSAVYLLIDLLTYVVYFHEIIFFFSFLANVLSPFLA